MNDPEQAGVIKKTDGKPDNKIENNEEMQYKDEFDHSPQIIQYSGMKTFGYPTILPYPNLGMNKQRLLGNSEWRRIDLGINKAKCEF